MKKIKNEFCLDWWFKVVGLEDHLRSEVTGSPITLSVPIKNNLIFKILLDYFFFHIHIIQSIKKANVTAISWF